MNAVRDRLAWHVRLAARASRTPFLVAGLGGLALPSLLPVTQAWLVAAVATLAALGGTVLVAVGGRPARPDVHDVEAALEGARGPELVAHALLRAALILSALAIGLLVGGMLPTARGP